MECRLESQSQAFSETPKMYNLQVHEYLSSKPWAEYLSNSSGGSILLWFTYKEHYLPIDIIGTCIYF